MALLGRAAAAAVGGNTILSASYNAEHNQMVGASGVFNGGGTGARILTRYTHATEPVYELDQLGAGLIAQFKQNGVEKARIENDGDIVGNGITGAAGIYTFGSIPVLPASNPTAVNEATRKAYVDGKTTLWAATFFIPDVAARGVDVTADNVQRALISGANFTATHIFLVATSGTNTGTFSIQIIKAPFSGAAGTVLGTISWNPGGGDTLGVGKEVDISDHVFTANDFVQANISAISSPLQKSVQVGVRGFQTLV